MAASNRKLRRIIAAAARTRRAPIVRGEVNRASAARLGLNAAGPRYGEIVVAGAKEARRVRG